MTDAVAFRKYEFQEEIGEKAKRLLPSQRAFIFSPARYSAIAGGFASGKSYATALKGVILSAAFPGNLGQALCYRGVDVEKRLFPIFMEEVIPPRWIRKTTKRPFNIVLRNNSVINLEALHDASAGAGTKTRRLGSSLGWFAIDQAEEIQEEHFNAMMSRLRRRRIPKKFGFMNLNPAGRDWIYDKFFTKMQPWPKDSEGKVLTLDGKFYQEMWSGPDIVGLAVNSEENRISNGGFVEDKYFDSLMDQYGSAWVDRFVHCSFTDFKGSLFPDFHAGFGDNDPSVHVIEPFEIPRNWNCIGGIDPGGDSPWAVMPVYVDEHGNLIVTPGFHQRTGRVAEAANWIKRNMPYDQNRTTFVIDPENKIVTVELLDHGIYAASAYKDVLPGIMRLEGFMHVQKHRDLPDWYESTQPSHRLLKFRGKGSPKIFFFKNDHQTLKEFDSAKWDPDKPDKMWKTSTMRFDCVEAIRYVAMSRPESAKPMTDDEAKFRQMEKLDPATAKEWRDYERKFALRNQKNPLRDAFTDDSDGPLDLTTKKYDWYD